MNTKIDLQNKQLLLILGGIVAGFANGLLGSGGGIIIVWILSYALGDQVQDSRDIFACALAVMLPISVVSTVGYALGGGLTADGALPFLLPAIGGGLLGAILLDNIKVGPLKLLFAVIVLLSGILMVIGR